MMFLPERVFVYFFFQGLCSILCHMTQLPTYNIARRLKVYEVPKGPKAFTLCFLFWMYIELVLIFFCACVWFVIYHKWSFSCFSVSPRLIEHLLCSSIHFLMDVIMMNIIYLFLLHLEKKY